MKSILSSLLLTFLIAVGALAQTTTSSNTIGKTNNDIFKPSQDHIMISFGYAGWMNKPDSVKTSGFGRAFDIALCYDFPIKKTNFSFAAGIGFGTNNLYFKNQRVNLTDTYSHVTFTDTSGFKKYKLSTAYLEAPFELRYFSNKNNRNKGFNAAIGLRVGTLINAHTKARFTSNSVKAIDKLLLKRYMDSWSFAATARAGYGNFSLYGSFNLNTLFKQNLGPAVTPFSIGICISGL